MTEHLAYIGLGSNLQDPRSQLDKALEALAQLPKSRFRARSGFYHSAPLGPSDQPDFVNAVASLSTQLKPLELLDALQAIENRHGRVRERHWGPRVLDLDLLLYDRLSLQDERLTLPHPQMHLRSFVLIPLRELAPELSLPALGSLTDLIAQLNDDLGLQRLPD